MMRRYGLSMWVAVLVVLATFVAEPGASVRFSVDLFQAIGEVGGEIVTELVASDEAVG